MNGATQVGERDANGAGATVEPPVARAAFERHPSDLIHVLFALILVNLGLLLATVGSDEVRAFDDHLFDFVVSAPERITRVFVEGVQLLALLLPCVAVAVLLYLRRFRALGYGLLAAGVTLLITHFTVEAFEGEAPLDYLQQLRKGGIVTGYAFPDTTYLAAAVAVLTALAPFMNRPWRRVAWSVFGLAVFVRIATGTELGSDLLFSLALGWAVGSLVLLAFGAPSWTPRVADIKDAMARSGVALSTLRLANVDARGSVPWFGTSTDGREVFIKVEGRDQRDGDLLFRLYRFVRSKNLDDQRPFSSMRRTIEHEALVSLAAGNAGVQTPSFLAISGVGASGDSFLLAYEYVAGASLDKVAPEKITPDVMRDIWQQVKLMRTHRIAHRDLRLANMFLADDGTPWLIDFGFSELAATDRLLAMDVAQLLTASALHGGAEQAVAIANDVVGRDALVDALPLLQKAALSATTRHLLAEQKGLLKELQAEAQRVTGVEEVKYEELERIRPRTVFLVLALAFAVYILYPQIADISQSMQRIPDASIGWVVVVILCSLLTHVGSTISRLGTVPEPLPIFPTFLSQLASSFANKLTPGGAGGYAVNIRFVQRQGVEPAVAVAGAGVATIGGMLVQIPLTIIFVAWAGQKGGGLFHVPSARTFFLIALGFALVGLAVAIIPPARRLVFGTGLNAVRDARHGLAEIARRPSKMLMLLGGSFIVVFSFVLALAASVQAYGGGLGFITIGAAFLTGSVVGSASPTPGGLGGVEAALFAALTVAGLQNTSALSAVFLYRLATFWLPILPGWLALRVLRHRGEL